MDKYNDITCRRCGRCCSYIIDGRLKTCKHLIRLSNDTTLCRIYRNRLGTIIDRSEKETIACMYRKDSKFDYRGCPYNLGKPVLEVDKNG